MLESYSEEFFNDLNKYQGKVSYLGVLQPEDIQLSLSKYDLMLFPTKYFTEGFPGTILDAYEAGLPVVATRWKYAEEYVEDGLSGLLCDFEDEQDFIYKVTKICTNPDLIFKLKAGAVEKSKEYSPEAAWDILSANLDGHI